MKTTCILASALALTAATAVAERDQIHIGGSSTVFPFSSYVVEEFGALTASKSPKVESTGSGSQQKHLCIARTIGVQPEVVLMDEPCSALDPIATATFEEMITELKKTYIVVIVTHNLQQATRVSDWTAYFYLGELIEYGDTTQIFTKPGRKEPGDNIPGASADGKREEKGRE